MIHFKCACGQSVKVRDEYAGKRGKCPKCKKTVMVPVGKEKDSIQDSGKSTQKLNTEICAQCYETIPAGSPRKLIDGQFVCVKCEGMYWRRRKAQEAGEYASDAETKREGTSNVSTPKEEKPIVMKSPSNSSFFCSVLIAFLVIVCSLLAMIYFAGNEERNYLRSLEPFVEELRKMHNAWSIGITYSEYRELILNLRNAVDSIGTCPAQDANVSRYPTKQDAMVIIDWHMIGASKWRRTIDSLGAAVAALDTNESKDMAIEKGKEFLTRYNRVIDDQ